MRGGACPCRRTSFKPFDFVAESRPESEANERPERRAGKGEAQRSRLEGCELGARREREKANPPGPAEIAWALSCVWVRLNGVHRTSHNVLSRPGAVIVSRESSGFLRAGRHACARDAARPGSAWHREEGTLCTVQRGNQYSVCFAPDRPDHHRLARDAPVTTSHELQASGLRDTTMTANPIAIRSYPPIDHGHVDASRVYLRGRLRCLLRRHRR